MEPPLTIILNIFDFLETNKQILCNSYKIKFKEAITKKCVCYIKKHYG